MRLDFAALLGIACVATALPAQDSNKANADSGTMTRTEFEASLSYRTGTIALTDGVATLALPAGYRYLGPKDAERVIVTAWGNPASAGEGTLGMILPAGTAATDSASWAVIISCSEDGYVKDDEAATLDYDALLKEVQESTRDAHTARENEGYAPITLVGWAAHPHYDATSKKLHWAKDLQFGAEGEHSLNYDIRVLGPCGVLVLSAVATMSQLEIAVAATLKRFFGRANSQSDVER